MIDSNGMDNVPVPDKAPPLFFISATDIDKAATLIQELGFEIIYGGIQRNDAVSYFNMRDSDFNVITVCQNHQT
jgi:predicted enzyme related to lactoylglutathione lyase